MILDSLACSEHYESLHPLFKKVFKILKSIALNEAETTRFDIDGSNAYYMVQNVELNSPDNLKLEAHRQYIDIQVPIDSVETFGWSAISECQHPTEEYNEQKDVILYDDSPKTYFQVTPGQFVIFFPEDAHAPCIGSGTTKKVVVKVHV